MVSDNPPNDSVYHLLEEVFESSYQEADTSVLVSDLGEIFDSFSGQGFDESYEKILLNVLTENKRNADASKILHFISESAVLLDNKHKTEAKKEGVEDIDAVVHPLLKNLFHTLTKCSQDSNYVIRYRSCQLLYMILTCIQDHGMGEIDVETYESVAKLIESRRLDFKSSVRAHAVLLSKFFQDPSVVNDPVIAALCWQMQYDPDYHVRQNIVSIIAACEETIMPIAKRFLYDKNIHVRNAALLHICKRIGPRSFTTSQRILILLQCFTDPSDVIRRNAEQKLIPVWFRACGDKLCSFLKYLRLDDESLENLPFIKDLLKVLLKYIKLSQVLEEIEWDSSTCLLNLPLSGEKVFIWRQLFINSTKNSRLSNLIPPIESLIPFILKCFDDSSSAEVEICVFTELILFLMDILENIGIKNCEDVFPLALNLMRHPFVPNKLMPYLVVLYMTFSPKEKEQVHSDIFEVLEDLQKLMLFTENQTKNILLNCFAITSQVLLDESALTPALKSIKDNLIIHHLSSEDSDVKNCAISSLALYCHLDFKEAKLSWPMFENAVHLESSPLRIILLKGAFDILKCYGPKTFADAVEDDGGQEKFDEALLSLFNCYKDGGEESEIIIQGILKIYLDHLTLSPTILANVIVLYFQPEENESLHYDLHQFLQNFGDTKAGSDCLVKSYLTVINLLFDSPKNCELSQVNIKTAALQLLEFSKTCEKRKRHSEEKFEDLLVIKLCKKFLKKPWKISASDLYSVCYKIIPKTFEKLMQLKELVIEITESLQSSIFQQKNPYAKRCIKSFSAYLKKIKASMLTVPIAESPIQKESSDSPVHKRLDFNSTSSSIRNESSLDSLVNIHFDSSPNSSKSAENVSDSQTNDSNASTEKSYISGEMPITQEERTPFKFPAPTPRKIATASRSRLSRKTPARCVPDAVNASENLTHVFKTPSRKTKLDISFTKTC